MKLVKSNNKYTRFVNNTTMIGDFSLNDLFIFGSNNIICIFAR